MNILILLDSDLLTPTRARLSGRRLEHVRDIHRLKSGDLLKVGLLGGPMGSGEILKLEGDLLDLELHLDTPPPPKLPMTLILALPRPKVLNRVIASATTLGVSRIYLVNAWKVEKSYWKSPRLEEANLLHQRILGLEQARDTILPELHTRRLLRPFVEEELPALLQGTLPLMAHPGSGVPCPRALEAPVTLAIGPEGGFLPQEVELFGRAGFQTVELGPRILRVETAVAALVARLY